MPKYTVVLEETKYIVLDVVAATRVEARRIANRHRYTKSLLLDVNDTRISNIRLLQQNARKLFKRIILSRNE